MVPRAQVLCLRELLSFGFLQLFLQQCDGWVLLKDPCARCDWPFSRTLGPAVALLRVGGRGAAAEGVSRGSEETPMTGACAWCLTWWSLGTEPTFHFFPTENSGEFSSRSR